MSENNNLTAIEVYKKIFHNIEKVMKGQSKAIRLILSGFASGGHILLEDYPGTGKTTLAKTLALSIDTGFKRIQFTPDLLPSDILGVSIYDQKEKEFKLHKGPIFTNILLADEINRASPRTQSALLEAMAEGQVSIDGRLLKLEELFFVIATQNPVESRGTYPLPEAQMDRFALQFDLGYVDAKDEVSVLTAQNNTHPVDSITSCVSIDNVYKLIEDVKNIYISEELKYYIVEIVNSTRSAQGVLLGASPRASLSLMKTAKALALFDGQTFVTPDHIQELAVSVIAHRLVVDPQAIFSGQTPQGIVEDILKRIKVPV
ncbi:MAG: MoxR family ATPase [Desulfobacterales bacterium]|jgi:MoxR-like ATPase|nr:MoxR family ATPase [Desulfobacteraceae bacterium]MBT4365667.1 MoxR family ATPase [Desulfobacteraceae bacterium]MBT7086977.1 MoxR family ATPase [Desulfobacterales bacterium]MBT7698318.1 MoxR family ATPase [Desulfobacterales bacterium]